MAKKEKKKVKVKRFGSGVEERLKKIVSIGDNDDTLFRKDNEKNIEKFNFHQNWEDRLSLREQRQSHRRGPMRVIKYRSKPTFKKRRA